MSALVSLYANELFGLPLLVVCWMCLLELYVVQVLALPTTLYFRCSCFGKMMNKFQQRDRKGCPQQWENWSNNHTG